VPFRRAIVDIMRGRRCLAAGIAAALLLAAIPARGQEGVGTRVQRSLGRAAQATERGIRRAGEATGNAVGTAVDATGRGVGTAIDATGHGLQRAGEALSGSAPPPAPPPSKRELHESDLPPEDPALGDSAYDDRTDGVVEPAPEDGE